MRCPVCKAENNTTPQCRRCKADLSLLIALERRREHLLAEATSLLSGGDAEAALSAAEEADWLRGDEVSRRLIALVRLMLGAREEVWGWYRTRATS